MDKATTLKWVGWILVVLSVGMIMLSFTPGQGAEGMPVDGPLVPLTPVPGASTSAASASAASRPDPVTSAATNPAAAGLDSTSDSISDSPPLTSSVPAVPAPPSPDQETFSRGVLTLRIVAAVGILLGGCLVWIAWVLDQKHHAKLKSQFQQNPRWKRGRGTVRPNDEADPPA